MATRSTGVVKFFSDLKGFGFILPDAGGAEVFVHRTDLSRALTMLTNGQRVSFEVIDSPKGKGNGKKAANVELA